MEMKIAVYDTYVRKKDGTTMPFDVLVPNGTAHQNALDFAHKYLATVGQAGQPCGAEQCQFCHIEEAVADIQNVIRSRGYHIIAMEGCREA